MPEEFIFMTLYWVGFTAKETEFLMIIVCCKSFTKNYNLKIVSLIHLRIKTLVNESQLDVSFIKSKLMSRFETPYYLGKSKPVITDSRSLQKKTYFHKPVCTTLQSETEWVKTLQSDRNRLQSIEGFELQKDIVIYGDGIYTEEILLISQNVIK